ncbi:MAG TPA: phospho-N-acetylmuramoyl-pentapeptide-transferase [Thermomicrobiales bacterium]|jgi:phospho-N-acetylmuramoyl-pentapeptide-transferase|nr:phospho-N-acetylmuramoyl-pentapeptide-transferase [Thermomicrobiales bacterium]
MRSGDPTIMSDWFSAHIVAGAASILPRDGYDNMAASLGISGIAFVLTLLLGRPILNFLRQKRFGKQVRADGPTTHLVKTGTPTMGGVIFLIPIVILTVGFNLVGRLSMLLPVIVLIAAAILGAMDDQKSFVGSGRGGMTARIKMVWLLLFGVVAALVLHLPDPYGLGLHHIYIPFVGQYGIGWVYVPVAAIAIIGFANAVNLTDGLDTLAGGTAAVAFCAYGIIAFVQGQVGVVAFCFTIVGALMGFLWFNAHPAQVFMGDVGSLALGAALATAAFMTGQWLLLPIVGFVFVCEAASVMLQVSYFKLTKGKRLFKMTPLHHHFEVIGWSETQVSMRFWMIGMISGLLGVALALL